VYPPAVPPTVRLVNQRTGETVAGRVSIADSFWSRFRGLMFRRSLEPGEGLWIEPCSSIHMLGMRFAIDAVFLDRDGRVLKVALGVRPWLGLEAARGARAVIELPAGSAAAIQPGDRLETVPAS